MKSDAKYHYICLLDIHPLVGYLIKSFHNFYCVIFLFPCETISLFWVPVPYQVYILQIFTPSQFLVSVFLAVSSKEKFFNFEVKFILCYLLLHVSYLIIFCSNLFYYIDYTFRCRNVISLGLMLIVFASSLKMI